MDVDDIPSISSAQSSSYTNKLHSYDEYDDQILNYDDEIIESDSTSNVEDSDSDGSSSEDDLHDDEYTAFDRIMFESSQLSVRDVVIMISAFSLRHQLSDEAKSELANLLKTCAGPQMVDLNLSKYNQDKCFSSQKEHITYHYYCSSCFNQILCSIQGSKKLKNQSIICSKCQKKDKVSKNSKNYFIELDLKFQIEQLLSTKKLLQNITRNLLWRENKRDKPLDKIKDVHDGILYQKMIAAEKDHDYCILSINVSTDGAPLTKSGKRSFWPLQITLNDLSPKLRFYHLLLSGVMITEREPNNSLMNLYLLKLLVEPVNKLYNESIIIQHNDTELSFKIRLSNFIADSVARPIIQQRISYSGYFGCSWCYIHGTHMANYGIHYLMKEKMPERSNDSHHADVLNVEYKIDNGIIDHDLRGRKKKSITTRGIKGRSSLQYLGHFDMVWGFPYEKMHSLLLGVVYQLWTDWRSSDSTYKIEPKHVKDIEKRFLSITPTQQIHRLPRSGIVLGNAKLKASELQSWLYLYSLPCLEGILDDKALQHYVFLVKSAYTLSQLEISENELIECEENLKEFVQSYEDLYGTHRMTFNVHALLHAVQSVRQSGPLSINSAFPFESQIYNLKRYVKGPTGMDKQMSRKHLQNFNFRNGNTKILQASDTAARYCEDLNTPKRLRTHYDTGEKVLFCGRSRLKKIFNVEYLSYVKCIFEGSVYHSVDYKRAKKTDDTVVKLHSGKFVRIVNILQQNNKCYLQLSTIEIFTQDPFPPVRHIKKLNWKMKIA